MNVKYARSQRILILALLISLVMLAIVPGTTMNAKALTGFVKVSPSNGTTGQPTSLTLKWDAAPSNPYGFDRYYKYCYYKSGGTCNFQGVIYATQYAISGLEKLTTYFWQIQVVYCKDSSCTQKEKYEANNGQEWSFKTSNTGPGSFTKSSPADNALNIASRVLTWASSSGATSYQYCFSPDYNDNNCAHLGGWKNVGNVTTYTLPNDSNFIWGNRYYWQIRASNGSGTTLANDGAWWTFTTANLVGSATLISPTGVITGSTPTYRWNHVAGVAWYYLFVNDSNGNVFKQWYDAAIVCSGGICAANPSITLGPGSFTWWIQTWSIVGYGPWSNPLSFNTPVPTPPTVATLVSPTGNIGANYSPTYTWNAVVVEAGGNEESSATWYYLWVQGAAGKVHAQWYQASSICSGGICSVQPPITLSSGNYNWWVQTWNSVGSGPWSAPMSFTIPLPAPPVQATLISPNGGIATNNPTYTWNAVSGSTWYFLWVDGPSGNILKTWYSAAQANCAATCSVAGATPGLSAGTYTWKVQTWNEGGSGPWSANMTFNPAVPAKPTLNSPTGNIVTNMPTYNWDDVSGATWYYLWVNGPSGKVIAQWYSSAEASCNGVTCSVASPAPLSSGAHIWWVQAWNDAGVGPWSDAMTFSTP